jgi:hypothetical protein
MPFVFVDSKYKVKNSGFLPNPFDPRDVWEDEILGGETITVPRNHLIDSLRFEPQGSHPFCVSMATTKMAEYLYGKNGYYGLELSPPFVYYNSGGGYIGSYFRSNLDTLVRIGSPKDEIAPMPDNLWEWDRNIYEREKRQYTKMGTFSPLKVKAYIRISPDAGTLREAIIKYGPLLVGGYAGGGWWNYETKRQSASDNHAVLLVGWAENGAWHVFDSLQPHKNFDGYHVLSPDYGFHGAYAVTELPADWREKRDKVRSEPFENVLNHYGKPRNFEAEVRAANKMLEEFTRFKNQSVLAAAGRFWTVLVNMVVYGGYSISYRKWGRWQPGDIINFVYAWRRTEEFIFDPNKERKEYS